MTPKKFDELHEKEIYQNAVKYQKMLNTKANKLLVQNAIRKRKKRSAGLKGTTVKYVGTGTVLSVYKPNDENDENDKNHLVYTVEINKSILKDITKERLVKVMDNSNTNDNTVITNSAIAEGDRVKIKEENLILKNINNAKNEKRKLSQKEVLHALALKKKKEEKRLRLKKLKLKNNRKKKLKKLKQNEDDNKNDNQVEHQAKLNLLNSSTVVSSTSNEPDDVSSWVENNSNQLNSSGSFESIPSVKRATTTTNTAAVATGVTSNTMVERETQPKIMNKVQKKKSSTSRISSASSSSSSSSSKKKKIHYPKINVPPITSMQSLMMKQNNEMIFWHKRNLGQVKQGVLL